MAIQSMQLDPNAASYTDNEIVGKINTATDNITRASSVAAAARPIATGEVTNTHIAADAAIAKTKLGALAIGNADVAADAAIAKTKLGALAIVDADVSEIGGGKLTAGSVTNTQVATGIAKDNLDAMTDITRGYIKTNPITGEFKVIAIHRQADGKLDVEYDNVAV